MPFEKPDPTTLPGCAEAHFRPLVAAVRKMREAQKDWFTTHSLAALDSAKRLERGVDAMLREIDTFGQPKQGNLL